MLRTIALVIVLCSDLFSAIRVPVVWNSDSEVRNEQQQQPSQTAVQNLPQKTIPAEYFVYTAEKPQFAVDIAAFHGVPSPENHYKAYPVRPYTGVEKPDLGQHKILDQNKAVFQPYQEFTKKNEPLKSHASPATVDYEIFHPYKAEVPALQQIYKDPVLEKIRNDIQNSQHRLKNYENDAGKPDIAEGEYLESPEQTDRRKIPQRNVPVPYEIHRSQRRPIYYRPLPRHNHREQALNHKFRHPWNQNHGKIRPVYYRPLNNHLQKLRQHHAIKFDDERNEYPQVPQKQDFAEPSDGYDIYEKGKEKYVQLRNNVDESINKAVKENRPTIYQKLELQNNGDRIETQISDDDDEEFVPVKNYAQVRKTESTKHLPREAAFEDADNLDEIRNAPRLREAVKSTKAQTVYTEEGYEDAAYDHAGEQKHASEDEAHGGHLKEKEISGGKYKIPSLTASYEDGKGNSYRDQTLDGKKWKNSDKDNVEETESEDYSEDEQDQSVEAEIYQDVTGERNKRENNLENENNTDVDSHKISQANMQHEVNKRETKFKVPEINLNSTYLTEEEISKIAKVNIEPKKDEIKEKYPYYFENLKNVHKDSPLRYAENLKLIPKKSKGGTEFYDSRSKFECPEVDDKVDAIPEKLKKKGHPDSDEDEITDEDIKKKGEADFDHVKEQPRLRGLGDKIDCFKAKYFGENPLDSPFFKEDIISNPEPVTAPNIAAYKLKFKDPIVVESSLNNVFNISDRLRDNSKTEVFILFDKLNNGQKELQDALIKTNNELRSSLLLPQNWSIIDNSQLVQQSNVYSDVLDNIKSNAQNPQLQNNGIDVSRQLVDPNVNASNSTYDFSQKKEDFKKLPPDNRKKRSVPFVYEPYKIIRDGQVQDSKRTTITSNTSPLIKQLQSSRVVDRVSKSNLEKDQPVKRNVVARTYKDIGKKDREAISGKDDAEISNISFVDVNMDQRKGEPRYELRPVNHKPQYTPVENKKTMSVKDYEAHTNNTEIEGKRETKQNREQTKIQPRTHSGQRKTTERPFFDVSKFLPKSDDVQKPSASNTVRKIIKTTTEIPKTKQSQENNENNEDEEDYEEYDDEEESTTTTTTTTPKPSFRKRKARVTTTTVQPKEEEEIEPELPKLRLITRFRNLPPSKKAEKKVEQPEKSPLKQSGENHEVLSPKYREKKKKSTKSTLVTDTKTYGDGDSDGDAEDDIRKDEVDALIGVQHDMDEYIPRYEKEAVQISKDTGKDSIASSEEDNSDYDEDDEDEDADDDEEDEEEEEEEEEEPEPEITTPEPTKRTLVRTTEAPSSTTEARSAKLELKPIVMKKKIEIHKELPVNKSSPHITQFKQDIKEVEIIKEIPTKTKIKSQNKSQKKPQKNLEALELYKDDSLAKDINKLGGVEVFKEDIDLKKGPRHGGNYRSARIIELSEEASSTLQPHHGGNLKAAKEDAETSQSENKKLIELEDTLPARRMHGGNLKSISDVSKLKSIDGRNAKLELDDALERSSHRGIRGGNLRSIQNKQRRGNNKSAKLIELDDQSDDVDNPTSGMHGGNFKSYGRSRDDDRSLHGGNYRSARIVQDDENKDNVSIRQKGDKTKSETLTSRSNAADILNSFAQVVPILTTTPAYILDPSKRMYYYVDA